MKPRLAHRHTSLIRLLSDGLAAYGETVSTVFCENGDYEQVVNLQRIASGNFKEAASRFNPAEVVKTERKWIIDEPEIRSIQRLTVENQNHALGMLPQAYPID